MEKEKENIKEVATEESEFDSAMKDLNNIVKNHKKTMKRPKMPPSGVPPLLQSQPTTPSAPAKNPVIHINLPSSLSERPTESVSTAKQEVSGEGITKSVSENNIAPDFLGDVFVQPPRKRRQNDPRPLSMSLRFRTRATQLLQDLLLPFRDLHTGCLPWHDPASCHERPNHPQKRAFMGYQFHSEALLVCQSWIEG